MLADTLVQSRREEGLQVLLRRGERGARELTTHRLTLAPGKSTDFSVADEETIVVLLEGHGTFEAGGQAWSVQRANVFSDRATALLLPTGIELTVHAEAPLEALLISTLISTPAPSGGQPVLCAPDDVVVVERGTDLCKREVRNLFTSDPHAKRLMVGETVNATGHWSSYPPHKHDGQDGGLRLEEMSYYRVNRRTDSGSTSRTLPQARRRRIRCGTATSCSSRMGITRSARRRGTTSITCGRLRVTNEGWRSPKIPHTVGFTR